LGSSCNIGDRHPPEGFNRASSVLSSGEFDIENDSTLQGAGNITVQQGRLVSLYRAESSTNRATIIGNLQAFGADIIIGESAGDHVFGQTLYVQGNVSWSAGVYRPYLNYAAVENDQWISTGVFRIFTGAKFGPVAVNAPGNNPGPWNVIWGIGGVTTEADFTAANFEIAGWSASTVPGPPDPQNPGQSLGQAVELRVS
jgi:hypothetical protein